MKTKTEIQIQMDQTEQDDISRCLKVMKNILAVMSNCHDTVTFRCWDVDHDYQEYNIETLLNFHRLLNDILFAEEIGFNHKEGEMND